MRGLLAVACGVLVAASCAAHDVHRAATWEDRGASDDVRVERATRGARVVDARSGIGIRFDLASPGDMRIVRVEGGVEDEVRVSGMTSIDYAIELEGDARLRFVGGVLELLDPSGAPRLHVAARDVRDANGVKHPITLSLSHCRADSDPRAPWGRPTTSPGASTCTLGVSWAPMPEPVTVDPGWIATKGMMSSPRSGHTATTLADGRVLVTGGVYGFGDFELATAELFDPATQTFAMTGSMSIERYAATAQRLQDGRVLVAGGLMKTAVNASADVYDPMTGKFTPTGALSAPRYSATSTTLSTGEVLVAGGFDGTYTPRDNLEVYANGTFTNAGTIDVQGQLAGPPGRSGTTLTELPNGDVLIVGGTNYENTMAGKVWAACVLYHPKTQTFDQTGSLAHARYSPAAFPLPDGRVWVAGGMDPADNLASKSVEIYDPKSGTFSDHGTLRTWRANTASGILPKGHILLVGGNSRDVTGTTGFGAESSEIYDPVSDTLRDGPALPRVVSYTDGAVIPPSAKFPNGGLLVAGGSTESSVLATGAVIEINEGGQACKTGAECAAGRCDNGRCCAQPDECAGSCRACDGKDGACGPSARFEDDPGTCEGDQTCDGAGGCASKNGRACTDGASCASGFCTEGVCCESACTEPCGSCARDGRKGSCLPVPVGTPPRGSICAPAEGCSGVSIGCTRPTCASESSSRSVDGQIVGCSPYTCGKDGACLVACKTALDCVAPSVCDRGRCAASRFDVGAAGCTASGSSRKSWWPVCVVLLILRRRRWLVGVGASLLVASTASASNFDAVGQLAIARFRATAVALNNGNIWISAGCDDPMPNSYCANGIISSSEIWDGQTSTMGPDVGKRYSHTATVLASGKVLVVGGCIGSSRDPSEGCDATESAVLCDVPGSCTAVPNTVKRGFHTATLLGDGRVLVAGGFDGYGDYFQPARDALDTTQIYDPQQNAFTPGPTMNKARGGHAAVLLADGRVLLVGGAEKAWDTTHATWFATGTTEIFDPMTNQLAASPPVMKAERIGPAVVRLGSNDILVASGHDDLTDLDSAEIFNAANGTFTLTTGKLTSLIFGVQAAWLGGLNKAVVVGGFSNTYDPITQTFGDLSQLAGQVREYGFAQLSPISVILLGGHVNQSTPPTKLIQVFRLRSDGAPCMVNLDCNSANCIDQTCCASECDGRCVACERGTGACSPVMRGVEHGTCKTDGQCDGKGECRSTNGHACAASDACLGGICADGVCCESTCTGACVACDRKPAGACLPIVGVPGLGHPSCPAGTACGGGSAECVPSICDGDHTIRVGDKTIDCTPYRCDVTGRCLERCSSIQHCVAPYACTPDGLCDKPAFDHGAGCDESSSGGTWLSSLGVMAMLALLRSRRASRRWA